MSQDLRELRTGCRRLRKGERANDTTAKSD
jgi:hypothetical protein